MQQEFTVTSPVLVDRICGQLAADLLHLLHHGPPGVRGSEISVWTKDFDFDLPLTYHSEDHMSPRQTGPKQVPTLLWSLHMSRLSVGVSVVQSGPFSPGESPALPPGR